MANQLLARLGIVLGVDSSELVTGLNDAKAKFGNFTKEVQRQSNEAAKMTMALKYATDSYGKSLTAVEKVELELKSGRLAGNMVSDIQLKALRDQAAAYDAVAAAAKKSQTAQKGGLRPDLQAALGYQATDVITGLAGGQNPFMVLLQQGGQLRDQFGGFKPMFEGIASVLTAARVAAVGFGGALATLAYAAYKGNEEQKQFNNTLILTGGYLNMSEKQFTDLAVAISGKYHTSLSGIRSAMQTAAATGQFTATSLASVGNAIAQVARLSGQSADVVASALIPAFDGSASSAKKLNDQYHFLTAEQYQQIRQLAAQGKTQESIKLTTDALTQKLSSQKEELGFLARAWDTVTNAVSRFWQRTKDSFKNTLNDQVEAARMALDIAMERAANVNSTKLDQQKVEQARALYEKLKAERDKKVADDAAAEKTAADEQAKIDYIASGRRAKDRQIMFQAEDADRATAAAYMTEANDKVDAIEQKRLQDRDAAIRATRRANLEEEGAHTVANAKALAAKLREIDAKAYREKADIYEKDREAYRLAAQAQSDEVDREKERIDFYKEHILLQGADLEIALTRMKVEQEIAALYKKKDSGTKEDKDAAAEELRRIQARREANINQAADLKMLQDLNSAVFTNMTSALDNFVKTGKFAFKDFARSVILDLMAIYMKAQLLAMFRGFSFFGGGAATPDFADSLPESFANIPARATGGSVTGGTTYMVGENGPELFTSNTSGTIIPNGQVGTATSGGSGVTYNGPYIANMSAIDTQSALQFLAKNKQAVWSANQSAQRALPMSR
jgi:phage-related minor tail protein